MTEQTSASNPLFDEIQELFVAAQNDDLSDGQAERLERLVCEDATARRLYARYVLETASLRDWAASETAECEEQVLGREQDGLDFSVQSALSVVVPTASRTMPGASLNNWLFSYFAASVILCIALLGGWAYKITHYDNYVVLHQNQSGIERPQPAFVGRITGMADCQWTNPNTRPYASSYVPLGRKYELTSGLLEITYTSGARVILEGPCSYTVDSDAGGRLQLGKLVARVEKRGERREERGERHDGLVASVTSANPQAANPESPVSSPQPPAPLFSVTTPTAIVTDLGTEFGVEVNENGDTTSHVFRGSVKVQATGAMPMEVLLRANESARVENDKTMGGASLASGTPRIVTGSEAGTPPKFARRIYEPPKRLDLLDIVADGNGMGRQRERGINPVNGYVEAIFVPEHRGGDRQYHLVEWHDFIDGVFVPDGNDGPVQLDSTKHFFDAFPATCGTTWGTLWARAVNFSLNERTEDGKYWIYGMGSGEQFMPLKRGLLCCCPNVGITFDLAAMKKVFKEVGLTRFHATAGLVDARYRYAAAESKADLWIFVDGRLMLKRMGIRPADGAIDVGVDIDPDARFLSIVWTDGGNRNSYDWVVLGDPVIEISPLELNENTTATDARKEEQSME